MKYNTALIADAKTKVHRLITGLSRVYSQNLQVNAGKRKMKKCTREDVYERKKVLFNRKVLQEIEIFMYLDVTIAANREWNQ